MTVAIIQTVCNILVMVRPPSRSVARWLRLALPPSASSVGRIQVVNDLLVVKTEALISSLTIGKLMDQSLFSES